MGGVSWRVVKRGCGGKGEWRWGGGEEGWGDVNGSLAFEELGKLEADARTRELLTDLIERLDRKGAHIRVLRPLLVRVTDEIDHEANRLCEGQEGRVVVEGVVRVEGGGGWWREW